MMTAEERPDELERRLSAHFAAERERLHAPSDLWARVGPRLDAHRGRARWPRPLRWVGALQPQVAGAVAVVLLLVGGVATWRVAGFGETAVAPAAEESSMVAPMAAPQDGTSEVTGPAGKATAPAISEASISLRVPPPTVAAGLAAESAGAWAAVMDTGASVEGITFSPLLAVVNEGNYLVVLYALTAPDAMEGWSLVPRQASMEVGGDLRLSSQMVSMATVQRVSLGLVSFPLKGQEAGRFLLTIHGVDAVNPQTGERRSLDQMEWGVVPLIRQGERRNALQTLHLRSDPCFSVGGVTLDVAGGEGCVAISDGQWQVASLLLRQIGARDNVTVPLVFYEPEVRVGTFSVGDDGVVHVAMS